MLRKTTPLQQERLLDFSRGLGACLRLVAVGPELAPKRLAFRFRSGANPDIASALYFFCGRAEFSFLRLWMGILGILCKWAQ